MNKSLSKTFGVLILIASLTSFGSKKVDGPPEAEISNGIIHARILLPDPDNGYYRGSRFDWSGVIADLTANDHSYYGQWFPKYAPRIHDAIMGPVEDFLPVGYEDAKPGETFLKIGVGMLARMDTSSYSIVPPYEIINAGVWNVKAQPDQVEFLHSLIDSAYGYEYKKTIRLVKDKPEMVLSHTLKNTGKKTIETVVYDHNFFMLDNKSTGQGISVAFPFNLSGKGGNPNFAEIRQNQIVFTKNLAKGEHVYYGDLRGFSDNASDYDIKVENENSGAGAEITSDQPLAKLAFWCATTTVCPEPFIKIKVRPGEEFSWKIFYRYYTANK